jgi:cytoskeleton protein RodZ
VFEIGSSLREARLRQGVDLVDAEASTKIRAKYLRALEDEQFDVLPAQTYVKGFLRSYADYLGLDGQLYVDEFNSRYVSGELEDPPAPLRTSRSTARARAHRQAESRVLVVALAGIAVVTALVVVAWKWGGQEPRAIPNLGDGPATSGQVQQQPQGQTQAPAVPAANAVQLELTALRGNSWIAVHKNTASGDLLFAGTLERGRSMTFSAKKLWLNIGTPENVQARINGDRSLIPGGKGAAPVVVEATRRGFRALSS